MAACDHLGFNVFYHTYQNYWNDLCRYNTPDISYSDFLTGVSMTYATFPPKAQLFCDYQTQLLNSCLSGSTGSTGGGGAMSFTVEGDNGTPFTIVSGDTLEFVGLTGIDIGVNDPEVRVAIDYDGADSFIMAAANGTSITVDGASDKLVIYDNDAAEVKYINANQLGSVGNYWSANTDGSISTSGMSNVKVESDIIQTGTTSVFSNGNYTEISTGYANTGQLTFNADHDGGVSTNTYTPFFAGNSDAGMTVVKMPSGGHGGLDFYVKNHGTTSGSQNLSTFTKILELNQDGNSTFGGNILLGDGSVSDKYIGIGDAADLKIFHNGGHSIIRETGTGSLYLQSDNNVILSKDSSTEPMVKGIADGAVELYHDNVKKLETTDTGAEVTGNLTASTALFAPIITGTTGIINGNLGVSGRTLLGTIDAAGASYSNDKILVAQSNGEVEYLTKAQLQEDISAGYWSANTDGTISTSGMSGVNVSGDVKTTESVEATQGFKAGDAVGISAKANALTRLEFNGANTINLLANDSDALQIEPTLISMQQDIAVTNAKKLYWNDVNTYIKGTATEIEIDGDDTVKIIADHDVTVNSGRLGITGKTIMGTVDAAGNAYTNNKILVVQSDGEVEYLTSQQIANLNSGTTKYWTGSTEQANSIVNSGMTLTKVGIGTAKPLKPLTVKGDISGSTAIYLGNHNNFISGETSSSGDLSIHSGDDIELYAGDDIVLNTDCRIKFTYLTGTTAPHLHPGIEFSLDDSPGNCLIQNGQENTVIAVTSADTRLYFNDIGGEYIVGDGTDLTIASGADILLTPTGKVGIGTTVPNEKLTVVGNVSASTSVFSPIISGTTAMIEGNLGVTGNTLVNGKLQIASALQHIGDTSTEISFDNAGAQIDFLTEAGSRIDLNNQGVRLGGANSRVTTILDEDNMASDSNTSLSTQQSIKAYVDSQVASNGYWTANTDGSISTSGMSSIKVSGDVKTTGTLYVASKVELAGDSDTFIQFAEDAIGITAGGEQLITISESGQDIVKIGDGGDVDFQVRTENDNNTLYVEGETDNVGIGTNKPIGKLDVNGGVNVTGDTTMLGQLIVSGTGENLMSGDLNMEGGDIVLDNTKKVKFKNTAGTEFGNILMNGSNDMIFQNARTGSDILIRAGGSGSGDTIFTTNQSGTDTEIMIVKGETTHLLGGVGIKTSLPNEALTVVGNISASTSVFSPIISGTTSLVNGNLGVTGNTLISGELGIGTAPSAALHISTSDNVLTKLVSTDSIATIELGDNSTSNQAALTRVSNDLKICKDGGNVGIPIAPKTKLDVQHNPTSLSNNTGGGESVTFGTASGSLTQGKLYYLNTSGVWTLTQANASSSNGSNQLLGIALGTAVSDGLLIRGFFDMHSYLTGTFNEGIPLYVCETTAGNINVAAPGATNEFVRVVGYCTNTSKVIYFNPDGTYITVA